MIETSLRVRDDLVADSASYNMLMTTMLRAEVGRPVWGNWTLDPVIEPGMVGVVDPVSGIFELHKPRAIPLEADVVEQVSPASWDYEGASVTHSQATGGRESWTFGESHTIVSRGTHHSRRAVDDPIRAAAENAALIRRYADARGYATGGRILQGFGIITATYQAREVVNLASRSCDQTFVLDPDRARTWRSAPTSRPSCTRPRRPAASPRRSPTPSSSSRSPGPPRCPAGSARSRR